MYSDVENSSQNFDLKIKIWKQGDWDMTAYYKQLVTLEDFFEVQREKSRCKVILKNQEPKNSSDIEN